MGTLVCRVELNKGKGLILTVENSDAEISQTLVLDGTRITTSVQGSEGTSVMVQDQESIAFKCKNFVVDAETVCCQSSDTTSIGSGGDLKLDSQANLDINVTRNASYAAKNTTVNSSAETQVKGSSLKLSADIGADLSAAMVAVDASGTLDLSASGITTLKGSLVKLG
jgi:hypothetical protein